MSPLVTTFLLCVIPALVLLCSSTTFITAITLEEGSKSLLSSSSSTSKTMNKIPVQNAVERGAVANDGSGAIYYFLKGSDPNLWVINIDAGWWCTDNITCQHRWKGSKNLMSTRWLPDTMEATGYISPECLHPSNPWCHGNMINVNYVSSDGWLGNAPNTTKSMPYVFMGRAILRSVIEDLFRGFEFNNVTYKIPEGARVVLVGESAGGFGTLHSSNFAGDKIASLCPTCQYWAAPDSGFFVGLNSHLRPRSICRTDEFKCQYLWEVEAAYPVWNASVIDERCLADMKATKQPPFHCLYGEVAVNYLRYRTFLIQFLYDAAELYADGGLTRINTTDLAFLTEYVELKRSVFKNFPSFLPTCLGHVLMGGLTRLTAGGVPLGVALSLWFNHGDTTAYHDKCTTLGCRGKCHDD